MTLKTGVEKCKAAERTEKQATLITADADKRDSTADGTTGIDAVATWGRARARTKQMLQATGSSRNTKKMERVSQGHQCRFCGRVHKARECPAYGKTCQRCGRRNHFAAVCRNTYTEDVSHATMHASDLSANAESEWTFITLSLETVSGQVEPRDVNIAAETAGSSEAGGSATRIFTDLELHRQRVRFQLDTGASCNVIGRHMLPPEAHLKPTNKVLSLYDH